MMMVQEKIEAANKIKIKCYTNKSALKNNDMSVNSSLIWPAVIKSLSINLVNHYKVKMS